MFWIVLSIVKNFISHINTQNGLLCNIVWRLYTSCRWWLGIDITLVPPLHSGSPERRVKNPTYLTLGRIWDSWASCHVSCRWSGSWPGRMSWAECCKRGNSAGGSSAPQGWHFHWKATEGRKWVTTRSVAAAAALIELIPKSIWWWFQSCSCCCLYQLHCGLHVQQVVIRFATFFSNTHPCGAAW